MDKNIKIVWILTIITSLLMIGGQSYWLYNQYNFSALEYMQTLHKRILEAEEEEADIRFRNRQIGAEPLKSMAMNLSGWTSMKEIPSIVPSRKQPLP